MVAPDTCGVITTLGMPQNGLAGGSGSSPNTSRTAPPIRLCGQRLGQGGLVDDRPASGVDDPGMRRQGRQDLAADDPPAALGQRQRDRQEIGLGCGLAQRVDADDPVGDGAVGVARAGHPEAVVGADGRIGLDRHHPQAVRRGEPGDLPADPAVADDDQRLAPELVALEGILALIVGPPPEELLLPARVDVLGHPQDRGDRVLADRQRVHATGVRQDDARPAIRRRRG